MSSRRRRRRRWCRSTCRTCARRWRRAATAPRDALALWRGPPLDDVASEPFAALEIRRLEELRLGAIELAGEVHRDRGTVRYASGAGAPNAARAALEDTGAARRPTLLVLDDVDQAAEEVRAALDELTGGLAALPVLVLDTAVDDGLPADSTLARSWTLSDRRAGARSRVGPVGNPASR